MPQLMRNLLGFSFNKRRRQIELYQLVELVQQRPLHDRPAGPRCIPLPTAH